jgi:hypothetical protein
MKYRYSRWQLCDNVSQSAYGRQQPHARYRFFFESLATCPQKPTSAKTHNLHQARRRGGSPRVTRYQQLGTHDQENGGCHSSRWRSFERHRLPVSSVSSKGPQLSFQAQFDSVGSCGAPEGVPISIHQFSQSPFQSYKNSHGKLGARIPYSGSNVMLTTDSPVRGPDILSANRLSFNTEIPLLISTSMNRLMAPGGMFANIPGKSAFPGVSPMFTPSPHLQQQQAVEVFPSGGTLSPSRAEESSQRQGFVTGPEGATSIPASALKGVENQYQNPHKPSSGKTYDTPFPSEKYLAQASSRQPRKLARSQPFLVVLGLNGTLLYRQNHRDPTDIIWRRDLKHFLNYLFKRYKVMIWSSAQPETVDMMSRIVFGKKKPLLIAQWAGDKLSLPPAESTDKAQVYKSLDQIWADESIQAKYPKDKKRTWKIKYRHDKNDNNPGNGSKQDAGDETNQFIPTLRWDQTNTVLIDDSILNATSHPYNMLQVPEFTKESASRERHADILKKALKRLTWLSKADDASCALKSWDKLNDSLSYDQRLSSKLSTDGFNEIDDTMHEDGLNTLIRVQAWNTKKKRSKEEKLTSNQGKKKENQNQKSKHQPSFTRNAIT